MVGNPAEREAEDQLAGARRPAERRFGIAHPFAGANYPP